ncbi:MAG: hypothetical protein JO323_25865 [Acidobacteriia bacterium]|nr:hypothetical protein [Terriglobia bacterium]
MRRLPVAQGRLLVKHVLPAIWRPIHSLWNEVIGFLFICLAVIGGFQAVRHYRASDSWGTMIAIPFTLLMLWFGVDSFRRARRISRREPANLRSR